MLIPADVMRLSLPLSFSASDVCFNTKEGSKHKVSEQQESFEVFRVHVDNLNLYVGQV